MSDPIDAWKGDFGNAYTTRNLPDLANIEARRRMWHIILRHTAAHPKTILEVGAGVGANLTAIKEAYLKMGSLVEFCATEPNDLARETLTEDHPEATVRACPAQELSFRTNVAELAFTSGVLIHIPPRDLERAMREVYRCAKRWVVCIEYFSSEPTAYEYRGASGLLWKRDFGGLYLDLFPKMKPLYTGFFWGRTTGLDNVTCWVFEKS